MESFLIMLNAIFIYLQNVVLFLKLLISENLFLAHKMGLVERNGLTGC